MLNAQTGGGGNEHFVDEFFDGGQNLEKVIGSGDRKKIIDALNAVRWYFMDPAKVPAGVTTKTSKTRTHARPQSDLAHAVPEILGLHPARERRPGIGAEIGFADAALQARFHIVDELDVFAAVRLVGLGIDRERREGRFRIAGAHVARSGVDDLVGCGGSSGSSLVAR